MADNDFYNVLGVGRQATQDEIKSAFRKLAKANHPDMNPGDQAAEDRFKAANEAFDVLGDAERRKLYDEFGSNGLRDGFDPEQARAYQRWAAQGPGPGGVRFSSGSGGFEGLGDLFGDVFGARGRRGPVRGGDIEAGLTVDFLTAVRGGEVGIRLDGVQQEQLTVKIPPGIEDGGRLRLGGKGQPGTGNAKSGDLILTIIVAPHPTLRREGNDLYMPLPVTVGEALLGARVQLQTPDGVGVTLTIPKRSQNAAKLRLKGKGAPNVKGGRRGDLYVVLDVRLPTSDDAEVDALARSLDAFYRDEATRSGEL